MGTATILLGDVRQRLKELPEASVQCCVTSPPYWGLRDYGEDGQIGLEQTPEAYVAEMVAVFREVWRVMADDGVLWLNLGDSYNGSGGAGGDYGVGGLKEGQPKYPGRKIKTLKPKDLVGIPWRVAFALQADGWYLRQDIIWSKPNPMPESVMDRCTKAHEYVFMFTKSVKYYFDSAAIAEPAQEGTRNKRSVWAITTKPFKGAHFAVMPEALVEPCVLASTRRTEPSIVLDPFTGSGTVGVVALRNGCDFVGTELNPEYAEIARTRIEGDQPMFNQVTIKGVDQ
jgi:site-specific DNA-methyltransferase (adenine-specific)/site-specific DNA-methyltransferase (cytosine-N4-specific)